MKSLLKILIVEDSQIFAQGLELLLEQHPLIGRIETVSNFENTLISLRKTPFDIIILDLNFETNEYDGFIIAKKVKQLYPKIKIMILTQHTRISHYERLFKECKVDAYLDKQLGVEETYSAIDSIMKGGKYVDLNISEMLEIESWMKASKRENDVIQLLIDGLTQKEIAEELQISPKTVEVHIRNLFNKFKVKNSIELVAKYVKYKSANRENVEDSIPPFKV
ncbi:response regulator transcription factor [Flavivirga jejuensis]|uniref:Response regulator transcription factor n=1 Tax=Flavivirga jejuensis TaxID=870487 RepID=A0ABT8WUU5_9FLAO|nr:response regulator transcription factor [Flavivirga jejuensis]MDO5976928.1 response regulator transcription factor [Flavivirga jejuensis]